MLNPDIIRKALAENERFITLEDNLHVKFDQITVRQEHGLVFVDLFYKGEAVLNLSPKPADFQVGDTLTIEGMFGFCKVTGCGND